MTPSDGYLRALGRRWWVVLLVLVVAVAASWLYTRRQRPVYTASTTLIVRPNSRVDGTSNVLRSLDTLERRSVIATFAKLPGSSETRRSVAAQLGLSEREVRRFYIRASVVPNTNIIKLEVRGPDKDKVADVANAAASKTRREARSLYRIFSLVELEEAVPARRPIYPNPQRNAVAAGMLGLFLGMGAALVFDRLRRQPRVAERPPAAPDDGPPPA